MAGDAKNYESRFLVRGRRGAPDRPARPEERGHPGAHRHLRPPGLHGVPGRQRGGLGEAAGRAGTARTTTSRTRGAAHARRPVHRQRRRARRAHQGRDARSALRQHGAGQRRRARGHPVRAAARQAPRRRRQECAGHDPRRPHRGLRLRGGRVRGGGDRRPLGGRHPGPDVRRGPAVPDGARRRRRHARRRHQDRRRARGLRHQPGRRDPEHRLRQPRRLTGADGHALHGRGRSRHSGDPGHHGRARLGGDQEAARAYAAEQGAGLRQAGRHPARAGVPRTTTCRRSSSRAAASRTIDGQPQAPDHRRLRRARAPARGGAEDDQPERDAQRQLRGRPTGSDQDIVMRDGKPLAWDLDGDGLKP